MSIAPTDAELMLRYRAGCMASFETLYARHKLPLYRYLLRHVHSASAASDLFQEVWSRVVASRDRYEARAQFRTYLFHIAHNCAIDHHRRGRRTPIESGGLESLATAPGPEHERPDRRAEYAEQQSAFLRALAELPLEQREAFLLHEEAGLDVPDIARITRVGVETAKSRLRYAIRKLQRSLGHLQPSEPERLAQPQPAL
jgi:RNA polymerase sigma-70 factor (ECF subfamily)